MNKAYNPKEYEAGIFKEWEDSKAFLAKRKNESKTGKSFTVPMPPPNVTGQLHLGHAMMLVIQDIMTRYHRMKGDSSLWLPGTDHAAIATESVVLKNLGVASREEFTREEFMEKCFDHTKKTHSTITNQVKKMGASCDFTRERYTMDLGLSNAVWKIFKDLYDQDLIVRGHRMVNWSTGAESVLADDELEYEDQKDDFAYIKCGKFIMGTVRSETKCADSPLVLHPDENYVIAKFTNTDNKSEEFIFSEVLFNDRDRRAKIFNQLDENGKWEKISVHQGKFFEGEKFESETYAGKRKFFVLCDDEVIDINKGTGAMTISVQHAADDYLLAKKYPELLKDYYFEKIGFDGKMTKLAGELEGIEVKIARKRAIKIMKEKNLIVGLDKGYIHNVPLCYRTGCVVEPMISPQWFIDVNKKFNWIEGKGAVEKKENKKIFYARHGESEGNKKKVYQGILDFNLTEKGEKDAKNLAKNIADKNIQVIISSDLKRAKNTAEIIKKENCLTKEIIIIPELNELNWGDDAGKSWDISGDKKSIEYYCENNKTESIQDIYARIKIAKQKIQKIQKENNGNILIVGHGQISSFLFAENNKILEDNFLKFYLSEYKHFENGEIRELENKKEENNNTFIFLRHGESEDNIQKQIQRSEAPLTDKGIAQAKENAEFLLKNKNITKIISSPTQRALQTAEIIANKLGLPIETFDEFSAYKTNACAGTKLSEVLPLTPLEYCEKKGGEMGDDFMKRTQQSVEILKNIQQEEGEILVVSHRSNISYMEAILDELTKEEAITKRRERNKCGHGILAERKISPAIIERKSLKDLTLEAITAHGGDINLIPDRFTKIYDQWIENLQDWCISRQIWWGHQIPIWYDENGKQYQAQEQKLLFVRHGESEDNVKDYIGGDSSLSEKGKKQSEELAETLQNKNISKIYHSSLKRSKETAEIVKNILENKGQKIVLEEISELHEVFTGELENTPRDICKKYPKGISSMHKMLDMKTGETMEEIEKRAKKVWEIISEKGGCNGNIMIVGHQTFLSQIFGVKDGCTAHNLLDYRDRWQTMKNGEIREVLWMMKPNNTEGIGPLRQDNDTLDTWFSSALWPFSTLGWPDKTPDFENFFPTNVLETGHDILFFWVARMIMFSRFATGKNPFSDVYLHGLVCDEHGKKMSKSKGNGIDPLEMIEKFGTDAVRMSLVVGTTAGNQVNLGEKKIEGFRNFANKLWNISRYIFALEKNEENYDSKDISLTEQWILSKTQTLISEVSEGIEKHKYGEVGQKLYDFTWNNLADWAIESAKAEQSKTIGTTLFRVLKIVIQLLHSYMPFITEVLWKEMKNTELLALSEFPIALPQLQNKKAEKQFESLKNVIAKIRSLRAASKVDPVKKITAILNGDNLEFLEKNKNIIISLARLENLIFGTASTDECVKDISDGTEIFLPLAGMLDMEKEKERKTKELESAKKMLKNLEGRMSNKKYMDNAPTHLVQQTKEQYKSIKEKIRVLEK